MGIITVLTSQSGLEDQVSFARDQALRIGGTKPAVLGEWMLLLLLFIILIS